ncbi:MAG: transposase [Deltaproteobacteria bacterium]|nr:transposase [Deltaproteobacteria bacterium]
MSCGGLSISGEGLGRARDTYIRRRPEDTILYGIVRQHLENFLAEARQRSDGRGLPQFVDREFREFLRCGVLAYGFARFRCYDCTREILVAFSCKGRGFCPSCCGRRMAELAAHLVDGVLGGLPVRQWVLTLPYRLRYALAWDHRLCRAVLAVFVRAVLGFERRRAAQRGIRGGVGGAVTAIQRFGSALNTNVHFHTLVVQGVFVEKADGTLRFVPSPAPCDSDIVSLLATVRRRIMRLVKRHGIDLEQPSTEDDSGDERLLEYPLYAKIQGAAVVGRVATGRRAGARVARVGQSIYPTEPKANESLHAHIEGFDLHAAVAVPAGDRKRLEHLCRYALRPPLAQERLELTADGKVVLRLRRTWRDGTRAICFEPLELLEKLAAMIPKPRINLLIYHGVLAPHARQRSAAVRRAHEGAQRERVSPGEGSAPGPVDLPGTAQGIETVTSGIAVAGPPGTGTSPRPPPGYTRPKHYAWADLLQRTFSIDILECPECGGRLRFLATIETRAIVEKILRHLGLPVEAPAPAPARGAGWLRGVDAPQHWTGD